MDVHVDNLVYHIVLIKIQQNSVNLTHIWSDKLMIIKYSGLSDGISTDLQS